MEREACSPFDIGAVILSPTKLTKSAFNHNCIIHSTIHFWKQIKSSLKIKFLSLLLPTAGNHSFVPSTMDSSTIMDLHNGDIWVSELLETYS